MIICENLSLATTWKIQIIIKTECVFQQSLFISFLLLIFGTSKTAFKKVILG